MFGRRAAEDRLGLEKRAGPAPISVVSSGKYQGNDGRWSTFTIRIGNPAQNINVLPSTLSTETWAVGDFACDSNGNGDSDCQANRGGDPKLFMSQSSNTWNSTQSHSFVIDANLIPQTDVYGGNYGYDTLGAITQDMSSGKSSNSVLDRQIVATISNRNIWISLFGISPRQPNFAPNNTVDSYFTNLYNGGRIPSKSYSYTAGSYYRNTNGSLTFGGYDSNRFNYPGISLAMATGNDQRDLIVGVQNIQYTASNGTKLNLTNSGGFLANVDSTVAPLWLPQSACDQFAKAFGLGTDSLTQLYTVSDDQHAANIRANATLDFTLGSNIQGGDNTKISFPYAAFDLNFTNTNGRTQRYFPLRVADSNDKFTLGRAFLQEAVLTADYGRKNFSVAQAIPVTSATVPNVVTISNTTTGSNSSPTSGGGNGGSDGGSFVNNNGISGGAIAGIVIGVVAALAIAGAAIWWFCIRGRKNKSKNEAPAQKEGEAGAHMQPAATPASHGSPPPVYANGTAVGADYFGPKSPGTAATPWQAAQASKNATPAGTPGVGPGPSAHREMTQNQPIHNATVNNLNWQQWDNGALHPASAVSTPGVAGAAAAGGAAIAPASHYELAGSDPATRPRELASPGPEQVRHEMPSPGTNAVEMFSPMTSQHPHSPNSTNAPVSAVSATTTNSNLPPALASPAVVAAVAATSSELPGASTSTARSQPAQPQHHSQRSSATLPHDMQPNVTTQHDPMPPNAGQNVTAAELASRRTTMVSDTPGGGESPFQPSPDPDGHASEAGYFSGSEAAISRNTSVMSAEPRSIQVARPTMIQHHRSASSGDMDRHVGTIAEEGVGEQGHDVTPP